MALKKQDTQEQQVATKATTKAAKKAEFKSEDLLQLQQEIIDHGFKFDIEAATSSALLNLQNKVKVFVSNDKPILNLDDYNALTVKPHHFALKRAHYPDDYTFLTAILDFIKAGFTPLQHDSSLGITTGISLTNKTAQQMHVYLKAPASHYSSEEELKALAQQQAEEAHTEAKASFYTVSNISLLAQQQLEANKQYNLQQQQEAAQQALQAQAEQLQAMINNK
jgi:6-phosphofructokinase